MILGDFYGANQGQHLICGVGVIIFFNHSHSMFIIYSLRWGSNIGVKYIALWLRLEMAIKKEVKMLQVMYDSKLVIDLATQKALMGDLTLEPILGHITNALISFEWVFFNHIIHEMNEKMNFFLSRICPCLLV